MPSLDDFTNYFRGKVVRVIDGDTLLVQLDLGFNIQYTARVRLAEINAPEMSTEEGRIAREKIDQILANNDYEVLVKVVGHDRYGRYLGYVISGGADLSNWMLRNGYAVKYEG